VGRRSEKGGVKTQVGLLRYERCITFTKAVIFSFITIINAAESTPRKSCSEESAFQNAERVGAHEQREDKVNEWMKIERGWVHMSREKTK
jgi:hypothetical protein